MNTTRTTEEINRELRTLSDKIAANPNDAQLYFDRAYLYQTNDAPEELVMRDYLKAIELDNQFGAAYTNMAFCLMQQWQYDDALRYSEKAVSLCPESAEAFINYAECLRHAGRVDEAFQAAKRALELAPENANAHSVYLGTLPMEYDVYVAFERSWSYIRDNETLVVLCANDMSSRHAHELAIECYNQYSALSGADVSNLLAPCYEKLNRLDEAEAHYLKCVEADADEHEYEHLIHFYLAHERYEDAIKWIEKGQSLLPDSLVWASAKMALCKANADDKGFVAATLEMINTLARLNEEEPDSYADYPELDDEINADRKTGAYAVSLVLQYADGISLGLWSNILSAWFGMERSWAEKCTAYMKWWDSYLREKRCPSETKRQHAVSVLGCHGDYLSLKWEYAIHNAPAEVARLRIMMDLLERIVRLSAVKRADTVLTESWAQGFAFYTKLNVKMQEKYAKLLVDAERKKQQEVAEARVEERNKVIQDMSHSIKNLVASVVEPLNDLAVKYTDDRVVIQKALRGAELIRGTVNALNLSFRGCPEDFAADAKGAATSDHAVSMEHLLILSLESAVSNMFDGKYFADFCHAYFPTRDAFMEAKKAWENVQKEADLVRLGEFLSTYMFDLKIDDEISLNALFLDDAHNSPLKLTILFQEMLLNAVKYACFAPRNERFVRLSAKKIDGNVVLRIENAFLPGKSARTTRVGNEIVKNIVKLMGGTVETHPMDDHNAYEAVLTFPNIFDGKK